MTAKVWCAGIALLLLLMARGPGLMAADKSGVRAPLRPDLRSAAASAAVTPAKPPVEVLLSAGENRRRAQLNETLLVSGAATGEVAGTNQFQFWVDNQLFAAVAVRGSRSGSAFARQRTPDQAEAILAWKPTVAGKHELVLKVITAASNVFVSAPLVLEAGQLQPPTLRFLERPNAHLLTTNEFKVVLQAAASDGRETLIRLIRDDLGDLQVTNGPVLALYHRNLPAGTYQFEAQAKDQDELWSEKLVFTCVVEPIERPATLAPSGFTVERATLPGQTREMLYPFGFDKPSHIAGASDALQLRWSLPSGEPRTAGTLVQRLEGPSASWESVAIVKPGICEWRDHGLRAEHHYRYRIAFLCDELSRTPFSAEAGETTSVNFPSYGVVPTSFR